jgi:hypothetical protein
MYRDKEGYNAKVDKTTKFVPFKNVENNKTQGDKIGRGGDMEGEVINAYKISVALPTAKEPRGDMLITFCRLSIEAVPG